MLVLLSMHTASAMHNVTPMCAPTKMDLSCSPLKEIVTPDGTPAKNEFRVCSPRYCTELPVVKHGTVTALTPIMSKGKLHVIRGEAVRITCNTGYELAGGAGASAVPICTDGCTFQTHDVCVPKKCVHAFQDLNGVVSGGVMTEPTHRSYLEFDEFVRITCNHGYMASNSLHAYQEPCKVSYVRECQQDGTLSQPTTRCVPLKCAQITSDSSTYYNQSGTLVPAGSYQPVGAMGYNDTVALTCDKGYFLAGGSPVRQCAWTCQFTTAHAQCSPTSCNTTNIPDKTHWLGDPPNVWLESGLLECENQHVFDLETCATTAPVACNSLNSANSATFDKELPTCTLARCKMSALLVSNSDRAAAGSTDDLRNLSAEASVMCAPGHRAIYDTVPTVVSCSLSSHFNATCGIGALGDSAYDPCQWKLPFECKPVMCSVAPMSNGDQSVDKGQIATIDGAQYMEYDSTLSITCNAGYGITSNEAAPFVLASAPKTTSFSCDAFCNSTVVYCKPVLCGHYIVPNMSSADFRPTGTGGATAYPANTLIGNITYPGTVTATCDSTNVLAGSMTCGNQSVVTCGSSGAFSPISAVDVTCVPAVCSVSELNAVNADMSPASGGLLHGQIANVTCHSLYRVAPINYSGTYVLCDHGTGYSRMCDGTMCSFAGQNEECMEMGCYGIEAYNTTDNLRPVHFRYTVDDTAQTVKSVPKGAIKAAAGHGVEVLCPAGYRIHQTEPTTADMPKTFSHDHCSPNDNCTLNRFEPMHCSRLTCGNFSMPNMSASGVRADSVAFDRASLVQTVLYGESITVTCNASHRLEAEGLSPACSVCFVFAFEK